jgi:hypothetical protein
MENQTESFLDSRDLVHSVLPSGSIHQEEEVELVVQPENLKINLYNHQLASIYKMEKFEIERTPFEDKFRKFETNIGINADPTGYGKTLSMVGLIVRDKMEWDMNTKYSVKNYITRCGGKILETKTEYYTKLNTTLILTNQSIIFQWKAEFQNTNLSVGVVKTKNDVSKINPKDYNVVLITCSMFNVYQSMYQNFAWKRFIYDEPGQVHIPKMRKLNAGFHWLVTATPDTMYKYSSPFYKNYYLGSIFYKDFNINDDNSEIKIITIKNSMDFIEKSFSMPTTNHINYCCYDPLFSILNGFVNDEVTKMITAGNVKEALKKLGGMDKKNIIDTIIKKKTIYIKKLYKKAIRIYKNTEEEIIEENFTKTIEELKQEFENCNQEEENNEMIEKIKKNIEKTEKDICEIKSRFEEKLKEPCCICFSNLENPVIEPNCYNIMCSSCMVKWVHLNSTCPYCRSIISVSSFIKVETDGINTFKKKEIKKKSKPDIILSILKKNPNGKFIIFSEYENTFNMIRKFFNEKSIPFGEIKGTVETRNNIVEKFKNGTIKILFLNSRSNGSGINLQETTDIILYHKMSESITVQVIGRANRIGRRESLNVHHLNSV